MGSGDTTERTSREFFHGTLSRLAPGTTLQRGPPVPDGVALLLDAGRPSGMGLRSTAVWAAGSIRDATAIAAIHAYSPSSEYGHEALRVYRAELTPFHDGPLAVIGELARRVEAGRDSALEALIREYWAPAGVWHIREVLAPSLKILEEVPATSERDVYVRRWVQYNLDRNRAQSI